MKRKIMLTALVISFVGIAVVYASNQEEYILRQTVFNNVTDYMATIGKSANDKKLIRNERRKIRRNARLKATQEKKRKRILIETQQESSKREAIRKVKRSQR